MLLVPEKLWPRRRGVDVSLDDRVWWRRTTAIGPELGELLEQDAALAVEDDLVDRARAGRQIKDALGELDVKERRWSSSDSASITTDDPRTLQEIGDLLHLSRERVRQIEARAKDKLRRSNRAAGFVLELDLNLIYNREIMCMRSAMTPGGSQSSGRRATRGACATAGARRRPPALAKPASRRSTSAATSTTSGPTTIRSCEGVSRARRFIDAFPSRQKVCCSLDRRASARRIWPSAILKAD